jgi:tetratricopeptide (TPR) repeat protein
LVDKLRNHPQANGDVMVFVAQYYVQRNEWQKLEGALEQLCRLNPNSPEDWYNLAVLKNSLDKKKESIHCLSKALSLNAARKKADPKAPDLEEAARKETNLASLRDMPEFKKLLP